MQADDCIPVAVGYIAYEFYGKAVGIVDGDQLVVESGFRDAAFYCGGAGAFPPSLERILRNGKTYANDLPRSRTPAKGARPDEERQDRAGAAGGVAEIEVVRAGFVEVYGSFDKAESEELSVEVDVALRIGGEGGDVVETQEHLFQFRIRKKKPGARSQEPEARSQKPGARSQEPE